MVPEPPLCELAPMPIYEIYMQDLCGYIAQRIAAIRAVTAFYTQN